MRGGSVRHQARYLPEDVLGLRAAAQVNYDTVTLDEIAGYLKDPNIVFAAGEGNIRW